MSTDPHAIPVAGVPGRPVRPRGRAFARVTLASVQLLLLAGFAWELEPLCWRPVPARIVSMEYETRWVSPRVRRGRTTNLMLRPVQFPIVSYAYTVGGTEYAGFGMSRHPFDEWRPRFRRMLRGRNVGSAITAYVAPYDAGRAVLVRRPNFAILMILTVMLCFTGIVGAVALPRRRRTVAGRPNAQLAA